MDARAPPPSGEVPSMYKKRHIWEQGVPKITRGFLDNTVIVRRLILSLVNRYKKADNYVAGSQPTLRECVFPDLDHRLSYRRQRPEILETCKQHVGCIVSVVPIDVIHTVQRLWRISPCSESIMWTLGLSPSLLVYTSMTSDGSWVKRGIGREETQQYCKSP